MKAPTSKIFQTNHHSSTYLRDPANSQGYALYKTSWQVASPLRRSHSSQSPTSTTTIYSTAFSPKSSHPGTDGNPISYMVGCTSCSHIAVWGVGVHDTDENCIESISLEERGKRRSDVMDTNRATDPLFCVQVIPSGEATEKSKCLYDLQFIEMSNGDHLLLVSGDPGVLVYKWADFLAEVENVVDGDKDGLVQSSGTHHSKKRKQICDSSSVGIQSKSVGVPLIAISPVTTFCPHPSPVLSFGEAIEINSSSYSRQDRILYGAAGDAFGCYQWDLETEKLLGSFGGMSGFWGDGHRDYLHSVKVVEESAGAALNCVITGGEDGMMGFWDGKARRSIEMINIQSTLEKYKGLVTNEAQGKNFIGNSWSSLSNGTSSWVSSMSDNGDWLAVGGGIEGGYTSMTGKAVPNSAGFMTLWHLPTRTFTSGCMTRETINAVVYNPTIDSFVTGGNEGRISFWSSTTLARERRSWSSPAATYSLSLDSCSGIMAVAGSGDLLDCFVHHTKTSHLHFSACSN